MLHLDRQKSLNPPPPKKKPPPPPPPLHPTHLLLGKNKVVVQPVERCQQVADKLHGSMPSVPVTFKIITEERAGAACHDTCHLLCNTGLLCTMLSKPCTLL